MKAFRALIWCLLLAAIGAIAWETLAADMGFVLIRWHGKIIETTVAYGIIFWLLISVALWSLWFLVRLPFNAWQSLAKKQARSRFLNGLQALQDGRYARAENLLSKAAKQKEVKTIALTTAHEAALKLDEPARAAQHYSELLQHDALAANIHAAKNAILNKNFQAAFELLNPLHNEKKLPPQAQFFYLQSLQNTHRALEALPLLQTLRKEQALPSSVLQEFEIQLHASAVEQCADADSLLQCWQHMPERLRGEKAVLIPFCQRADALGLESTAVQVLAETLKQNWQTELLNSLADISTHTNDQRIALCEAWLLQHPGDATLHAAFGRLQLQDKNYSRAEILLQRAIALSPNSESWEYLGHVFFAQKKSEQANTAYINALRLHHEQSPIALPERDVREQIASHAVAEIRNEHGFPILPKS